MNLYDFCNRFEFYDQEDWFLKDFISISAFVQSLSIKYTYYVLYGHSIFFMVFLTSSLSSAIKNTIETHFLNDSVSISATVQSSKEEKHLLRGLWTSHEIL